MNQIFDLPTGKIEFGPEKIWITDKAQRQRNLRLISSGAWFFYGFISILRFLKTGDQFLLWTGLIIAIGHLGIFIAFILRSAASEIARSEVKSIQLKKWNGNEFLDIQLRNGRNRRVPQIYATQAFRDYIDQFKIS